MAQKILFFTAGKVATLAELAEIEAIKEAIAPKFELFVRNGDASTEYGDGRFEETDFVAGDVPAAYPAETDGEPATGRFTVTAVPAAGASITIAGSQFLFVAEDPGAGEILIAANIAAQAALIEVAVNTVEGVTGLADATGVALTADEIGTAGNAIAIASSSAAVTVSGPTLTGGTEPGGYPEFDPEDV